MGVPVRRFQRRLNVGDATSPMYYYLRQEPGSFKTYTIRTLSKRIEVTGSLSAQDVTHSVDAFIRELKEQLAEGNKVKIDGLGTFYITFACTGTEKEKDCTVKNISRVHVRFKVDNEFRLANDSTATTRGIDNNVKFYIKSDANTSSSSDPGNTGGKGDDDYVDPKA